MTGLEMKYFVLKPRGGNDYAVASRLALKAYATAIRHANPKLADDLISWAEHETLEDGGGHVFLSRVDG